MLTFYSEKKKVMKLIHPCRCKKCENSCNYGSGAFAPGEIRKLSKFLDKSEEELKSNYLEEIEKFNTKLLRPKILRETDKPYGKCIFYDKMLGCTIHEAKPFECKIAMSCKDYGSELITWFDLRYFLNKDDPESLRQFKVYLDSGGETLDGAEFSELVDKKDLEKIESYADLKDKTDWEKMLGIKNGKK